MKRLIALVLSLVMLCAVFAGCSDGNNPTLTAPASSSSISASTEDFSETGILNLGFCIGKKSDIFLPVWSSPAFEMHLVFDSLIKFDADNETVVPKMAKEYSVSSDGLIYTFVLRDDIKWHDGEPVTVDDVVFSYNTALKDSSSIFKLDLKLIEGAAKVLSGEADTCTGIKMDGNKLTLTLTAPYTGFLKQLAKIYILPKHLLEDQDPTAISTNVDFWTNPVGCGIYKIDEVHFPDYFTLIRNEDYYGGLAGIKHITCTSFAEGGADALVAALIAGNIDYSMHTVTSDYGTANTIVAANPDFTITSIPSDYQRALYFNTAGTGNGVINKDIQKPEVRQAFNLIVDKEAVAALYKGLAVVTTTHVNPDSPMYNADIPVFKRDVKTAVQMLEDANYDFSKKLLIQYYYNDQVTIDIMALITQNFSEAGITVETTLITGDSDKILYDQRDEDMMYAGMNAPLDITGGVYVFYTDKNVQYNKLHSEEDLALIANIFNPIIDNARASKTTAEMKKYGDQLQLEGLKYMYTIPLYARNILALVNKAKLDVDPDLFTYDMGNYLDYKFTEWKLLSK